MSKIEVDAIEPQSGTDLTIGASGDTITIPSGATLTNSGTAAGFGISWQSDIKTSAFTAVAGEGYWINTTSAAVTVTLPASASVGDQIILVDYDRTWGTNNLTINRNGLNYQGGTENPVYDTNGQTVNIVYSGATNGWIPISDDDVADEGTLPPYSTDFLVIAGGGSGGGLAGGGGGAGGYRTSTQSVNVGTVITVTVGDGAAARAANGPEDGNSGSNSSISGSGLTTITSAGGGYGTSYAGTSGGDGGSGGGGGGGAGTIPGGSGNTPSTSPSQGNNGGSGVYIASGRTSGGGGGAGAVGGNGDGSNTSGDGGDGLASSITGSSVTRAGGGGGSMNGTGATYGTGGSGGGGDGVGSGDGNPGTANTGSGGSGASEGATNSGAGGKGVVILSVPTTNYSGTTTGSPTVSVSGSNTIMQFNGSGSYTA